MNSVAKVKPELLEEWDYEKNMNINPESVSYGSTFKYWWKCKTCGYSWQADPSHRVHGRGCPRCAHKVK